MTFHLGLITPSARERCWIEVAEQRRIWEEGKILAFDDTCKHEVHNDTDEDRVVLLMHVRRPLRFPGSVVGWLIFKAIQISPFVRDGQRRLHKWHRDRSRPNAGP
jgi:hypothetical protein